MLIFHLFLLGFLLVSLSSFLLKRRVKQEPEKPDALAEQTSPRPCKLTACNLCQNIRFNGSRKAKVSSLEARLSSSEKRDEGW